MQGASPKSFWLVACFVGLVFGGRGCSGAWLLGCLAMARQHHIRWEEALQAGGHPYMPRFPLARACWMKSGTPNEVGAPCQHRQPLHTPEA